MSVYVRAARRRLNRGGARPWAVAPAALLAGWCASVASAGGPGWPQFRGPGASGVGDGSPPVKWNVKTGENIRWQAAIPGLGHSCPIVWGERVLVTTAISGQPDPMLKHGQYGNVDSVQDDTQHTYKVLCLDAKTGKVIWEQTAFEGVPKVKRHMKATHANSTPATDGRHVIAFFGSEGLYCYDIDGKLLWKQMLGTLDAGWYTAPQYQWEFGSSPIIYKDMVIVQCDVQKNPFVAAYDIKDGKNIWLTPREDVCTWSTPTVVAGPAGPELVCNGFHHIAGYDPLTGQERWRMNGGGDIPVPTPFAAHGLVFLHSAHGPAAPIFAVKPGGKGDISLKGDATSNEFVAWSAAKSAPYIPTSIICGDLLYAPRDFGLLTCFEARTGKLVYRTRIEDGRGGGYTASPVAADGRIYFTSEDGEVFVIKAGPTYELLAANSMGDVCLATPAIAEGVLYVRTKGNLYAIAESGARSTE